MEDASSRTYLTDQGHHYDEDLIPLLLRELEKSGENNRLIIVHLAGSHHPYDLKYPESEAYFSPDTIENKYLNSIRYTDSVMQSIFEAVMKVEYPVAMLYTSDHGEYVNDSGDGFHGHGNRVFITRFVTDVPFFIMYNDSFLKGFPSEVSNMGRHENVGISHDNVSHTLLGLLGVYDSTYLPQFDLSSKGFSESPRYIIERTGEATLLEDIRFDTTASEEDPF